MLRDIEASQLQLPLHDSWAELVFGVRSRDQIVVGAL
jgi:hypothetical protein